MLNWRSPNQTNTTRIHYSWITKQLISLSLISPIRVTHQIALKQNTFAPWAATLQQRLNNWVTSTPLLPATTPLPSALKQMAKMPTSLAATSKNTPLIETQKLKYSNWPATTTYPGLASFNTGCNQQSGQICSEACRQASLSSPPPRDSIESRNTGVIAMLCSRDALPVNQRTGRNEHSSHLTRQRHVLTHTGNATRPVNNHSQRIRRLAGVSGDNKGIYQSQKPADHCLIHADKPNNWITLLTLAPVPPALWPLLSTCPPPTATRRNAPPPLRHRQPYEYNQRLFLYGLIYSYCYIYTTLSCGTTKNSIYSSRDTI